MAQTLSPTAKKKTALADFEVPAKVGKYQLLERIGSGTCGMVYRAYDAILSRDVAIKISQVGTLDQQTGKMPGAQKAFITETLSAGRLSHQNIVSVYDAGIDGPLNYLVMEYVEGVSLKNYGRGQTQLTPHRVVSVIAEVCKAIDFSHKKGIVHRDIKPANIMIAHDGSVKLLDFGIAISTTADEASGTGRPALGTPNYVSPEQVSGTCDQFALICLSNLNRLWHAVLLKIRLSVFPVVQRWQRHLTKCLNVCHHQKWFRQR